MTFRKGQSGNPAGRPPGARDKATTIMEQMIEGEVEAMTRKGIEIAKVSDLAAVSDALSRSHSADLLQNS